MPTATVLFALEWAKSSTPAKASAGSSIGSLLFIVVLFALAYVFFLRPRSQAARRQRETLMELSAGDEVLTGSGIFGTVLDVEPDRVTLETAPGTRITVVRSTIARRTVEPDANSVAEQNRYDEGHDGVAEAAGWHDQSERDTTGHEPPADDEGTKDKPEADPDPGPGRGGGR